MIESRRISTARWWNKKNVWILFLLTFSIVFVRFSKGSIYRNFYYFISKPFWPGEYQKDILLKSTDTEIKIKLDQLEKDNLRLRELLSLQRVSEENIINSSVISRKTGNWWQEIILNKGSKDGVAIGDAVVGPGGLLGIVQSTTHFTSSVKLLTSNESKVGVWNQKSNIHGLLIGLGNDSPKIIFYSKDIDIKVGDFVMSSPASTLLPPNIPIGIIESIDKEAHSSITANVQLIAKPQAIDWVQVIKTNI